MAVFHIGLTRTQMASLARISVTKTDWACHNPKWTMDWNHYCVLYCGTLKLNSHVRRAVCVINSGLWNSEWGLRATTKTVSLCVSMSKLNTLTLTKQFDYSSAHACGPHFVELPTRRMELYSVYTITCVMLLCCCQQPQKKRHKQSHCPRSIHRQWRNMVQCQVKPNYEHS